MSETLAQRILKNKKDPALQKGLKEEQLDLSSTAEDDIDQAIRSSKLEATARKKRKGQFKTGIVAGVFLLLSYGVFWLFKPFELGMTYGVCKVFLEQNVRYPQTLKYSSVDELRDFIRIWYVQIDAFGQYRLENIKCTYEADDTLGFRVKKIEMNKREVDPDTIAAFNKTLPIIFADPPDITYPRQLTDALGNVDIQTYLFRKPIF